MVSAKRPVDENKTNHFQVYVVQQKKANNQNLKKLTKFC